MELLEYRSFEIVRTSLMNEYCNNSISCERKFNGAAHTLLFDIILYYQKAKAFSLAEEVEPFSRFLK